jgi:hypothetical protein
MLPKLIPLALLLAVAPAVRADGCKFARDGRTVPEHEQRALIEWADGTETLYVAALSDATTEGSVWVVPVRSAATAVRAEPVEEFPAVTYYETLKGRAERQLRDAITLAAVLDSGGLCCPLLVGQIGGCGAGSAASAVEHSRVEKLGMVVTVVSAGSRDALERYLDAQGVNRATADLSSLGPYFGGDGFAFVCGWVATPGEPAAATGLKVVFPSPTLWFPLMPTRVYTHPVATVVYVRGFVKPADGCDLPGLKCEYIYGHVEPKGVSTVFKPVQPWDRPAYYGGRLERLSRVTLTTDPQKWDRDLELVPGTTPVGTAAVAVTGWAGFLGPLWSGMLGAVLGLAIPWLTVPKAERRWFDWLAGAAIGAAIVLTIWASALVFAAWRGLRFRGRPNQPRRYVVLPVLAVVHFAVVFAVCRGLMAWITAEG